MDIAAALQHARDSMGARQVFSEPIERDGTTVILAAKVGGGGGGGEGTQNTNDEAKANGGGVGYGFGAKPLGAFIIQAGKVRWRPAIDVNRAVAGMQVVAATALLLLAALTARQERRRARRRSVLLRRWAHAFR